MKKSDNAAQIVVKKKIALEQGESIDVCNSKTRALDDAVISPIAIGQNPEDTMDELSRLGQEIQGESEEDINWYNPLIKHGHIRITENSVTTQGQITHVEILNQPTEHESKYLEMIVEEPLSSNYPTKLKVRRRTLALELHCLLVQSDEILDKLVFWTETPAGFEPVTVEFVPPAEV